MRSPVWFVLAALLLLVAPGAAQLTMTGVGGGFGAPAGGGNVATFNSKATTNTGGEALTSLSIANMTVGSGVSRALILVLAFAGASNPAVTATWDSGGTNQAMANLVSYLGSSANTALQIFGLINPTSGNKTLAVSWSGAREANATALDFTHVNQTGGATSFPHTATNDETLASSSTPATVTVTSAANNAAVAMFVTNWLWSAGTATQTEIFMDNSLSQAAYEAQRAAGASSVSFAMTISASGHQWTSGAIDIAHD